MLGEVVRKGTRCSGEIRSLVSNPPWHGLSLAAILIRRYSLDDRRKATLAELSHELGISRERVRQVQKEAENSSKPGSTPGCFVKPRPDPTNSAS